MYGVKDFSHLYGNGHKGLVSLENIPCDTIIGQEVPLLYMTMQQPPEVDGQEELFPTQTKDVLCVHATIGSDGNPIAPYALQMASEVCWRNNILKKVLRSCSYVSASYSIPDVYPSVEEAYPFYVMYGKSKGANFDDRVDIKTFAKIYTYVCYFCHPVSFATLSGSTIGMVLVRMLSFANLSCDPNCELLCLPDKVLLVSRKSITKGDQLTIAHADDLQLRHLHAPPCHCGCCKAIQFSSRKVYSYFAGFPATIPLVFKECPEVHQCPDAQYKVCRGILSSVHDALRQVKEKYFIDVWNDSPSGTRKIYLEAQANFHPRNMKDRVLLSFSKLISTVWEVDASDMSTTLSEKEKGSSFYAELCNLMKQNEELLQQRYGGDHICVSKALCIEFYGLWSLQIRMRKVFGTSALPEHLIK